MRDNRRARVILALLLLTAFTLITLDYRAGGGGPLRRIGNAVFGPIENAAADVARPIGGFFSGLAHLSSYKHDNAKLRKQVAELTQRLRLTDAQRAEFVDMEKLLHLDQKAQFRIVAAHVVALSGSFGFESTATIDAGSSDGLRPDETVINGDGLVGRTLSVGPTTSTVLLGSDATFRAGARLEGSLQAGYVNGGGRGPMTFTLLDSQGTIQVGARLVTFGDLNNRPFVPEVPIGRVTKVSPPNGALTRTATVASYVRYGTLDVVGVVIAMPHAPPRDSLLPPRPTPTQSTTSPSPTQTPSTPPPSTPPASSTAVNPTPSTSKS
ncbi:MAG TPA: rod shape-determining protein MreC [Mycobacteriales bacterium]|nr:rod shape-determining protein MreC [Mycobacteriales bacterium]